MRRALVFGLAVSLVMGGQVPAVSASNGLNACSPVTVHVPQLMYHRVSVMPPDAANPDLWVEPDVFRATMQLLFNNGWSTMTSKEIAWKVKNCHVIPPKTFSITIDDGNRDGYDIVYPILEEFAFDATFAVVVKRVGVYKSSLDWGMLLELQSHQHEIANHSDSHVDLSYVSADRLYKEIETSNQVLYQNLGVLPRTFIYPSGRWNSKVVKQVVASRLWSALTTAYGCTYSVGDRFTEERIRVHRTSTPAQVMYSMAHC